MEAETATARACEGLAQRYAAAWDEMDLDAVCALHAEAGLFCLHAGRETVRGRKAIRAAFEELAAAWPGLRFEIGREHFGAGHFVLDWTMRARPGGREVAVDGVDVFEVNGGLIERKDTYIDLVALQGQLADADGRPAPKDAATSSPASA